MQVRLYATWLCCCVVVAMPAMAADDKATENFFEFLAELEKVDGQWVDPMQLPPVQQATIEKTKQTKAEQDDK